MSFNPDPSKQAQEIIFSHKTKITSLPELFSTIIQHIKHQLKTFWNVPRFEAKFSRPF